MGRNRKHYSESFKNKIVVELLKSGRRQEEVAAEYGVSPSTLSEWKSDFLSGRNQKELRQANKRIEELEEQNKALIEALGTAQLEVELLKKKTSQKLKMKS